MEQNRRVQRLAKAVRVLTIAPWMALLLGVLLELYDPGFWGGAAVILSVGFFLIVFPALAYPLQPLIPGYRDQGREGQRSLAMVMANIGYVGAAVSAFLLRAPRAAKMLCMTYLFSVVMLLVLNGCFHVRASGHACGVAGPMYVLIYYMGGWGWCALAVLGLVYWSSLVMKRHTLRELAVGSAVPLAAVVCALLLTR